jgi:hypothetical protein
MAAERSDRERFSHREAYERWTGDYWEKADNADQDDDLRVYPTMAPICELCGERDSDTNPVVALRIGECEVAKCDKCRLGQIDSM